MGTRMYAARILMAGLALTLSGWGLGQTNQLTNPAPRHLWHNALQQGYSQLATDSARFARVSRQFCDASSAVSKNRVRQAWHTAFMQWQGVRFVNFGPIETDNLSWQLQFWPDPKNLVGQKARLLLRKGAVNDQDLDAAGVAAQGFPLAEYLLFDTRMQTRLQTAAGCALLATLAERIAANTGQLAEHWAWFKPGYLQTGQYRISTVRAGMTALEVLEERRLAQPMGLRGGGQTSIYAADAWRSGQSLATVAATLEGLHDYYLPGLRQLLMAAGENELADDLEAQMADALASAHSVQGQALAELFAPPQTLSGLQRVYLDVSQLHVLTERAAGRLGIVRGFNASDGD